MPSVDTLAPSYLLVNKKDHMTMMVDATIVPVSRRSFVSALQRVSIIISSSR